jgi:hypothetical protein
MSSVASSPDAGLELLLDVTNNTSKLDTKGSGHEGTKRKANPLGPSLERMAMR